MSDWYCKHCGLIADMCKCLPHNDYERRRVVPLEDHDANSEAYAERVKDTFIPGRKALREAKEAAKNSKLASATEGVRRKVKEKKRWF